MKWINTGGLLLLCLIVLSNTIDYRRVKNFHRVNDEVCRSGQPNARAMKQIEEGKIKSVLNLRNYFGDQHEIKRTGIIQVHLPMRAKKMDVDDVINVLKAIKNAEKPILVHITVRTERVALLLRIAWSLKTDPKKRI